MTIGLLAVRAAVGIALVGQAAGKLSRDGRVTTRAYFRSIGFEPAGPLALLTGLVELGAGMLLLSGLATPLAAAAGIGVLVNASAVNAASGWASSGGGAEYPVVLGLVTAGLAFTGPGGASLDALLGWDHVSVGVSIGALSVGLAAATPFLAMRLALVRRARAGAGTVPAAAA